MKSKMKKFILMEVRYFNKLDNSDMHFQRFTNSKQKLNRPSKLLYAKSFS